MEKLVIIDDDEWNLLVFLHWTSSILRSYRNCSIPPFVLEISKYNFNCKYHHV